MKLTSKTVKQTALLVMLLALANLATACRSTAHGAGEDIERAGEKIQEKTQ